MTIQPHDDGEPTTAATAQSRASMPPRLVLDALTERLRAAGIAEPEREARAIALEGADDPARLKAMIARRVAGEPLALVLGRASFLGVPIVLAPGVLVPREETEILGRTALAALRDGMPSDARVIDMCCGSGNLACAVAHHEPDAQVWASDLTTPCVETTRRNVHELGFDARVTVVQGDLFAPLAGLGLEGTVDLVVCNPPYISTKRLETDRAELLAHEPREAFDAGPYGLSIHQRAIAAAPAFLRPGGVFMCEFGLGQAKQVALLFARARQYGEVTFERDAQGNERVAVARRLAVTTPTTEPAR